MGRVIAVANQKGGVGKTTTAVNLSACLSIMGKKVLLIDIDPQGNATSGLGINKLELKRNIYDVLVNQVPLSSIWRGCMVKNLLVAPASLSLAGAEIEMVSLLGREAILDQALGKEKEKFDCIIIDCPPSLGLLTVNALTASDSVLVPIQCEYYALEGLSQLVNTIELIKKRLNPKLRIEGVLLTMFDGRANLSIQVADEVKKHFQDKVYRSIIPRNVRLSEAPSHGKPVILYDHRSKGAEAYRQLAGEVAGVGK